MFGACKKGRIQEATEGVTESNVSVVGQEPHPASNTVQTELTATQIQTDMTRFPERDSLPLTADAEASPARRKPTLYLPPEQLTTPEVQKVVAEHVIKSSDLSPRYHGHVKIRPFSGKTHCPHAESDYDTWHSNVEFHLVDTRMSDKHAVRKIIDSLIPPAANIVKHLGP